MQGLSPEYEDSMRLNIYHRQRPVRFGVMLIIAACLGISKPAMAELKPFVIQDIRVEGLQRVTPGSVFAALPVGVGDTADTLVVRAAAKSLFASGNFDDISIARDGGVLVVVVA